MELIKIPRRQQRQIKKEVTICPVGVKSEGLPETISETFAYAACLICNDDALQLNENISTTLDEFKIKLLAVDLCRFAWCKNTVCNASF